MTDAPIAQTEGSRISTRQRALVEVDPHRWALHWWARAFRRLARRWTVHNHVDKLCRPFTIEGQEKLAALENPLLIIGNHTSHFDTAIVLHILPDKIYDRTAIVAAADRMYRERIKGMWHSLRYNAFPITRGGGREALAYSQWLLHHDWSLLIFPEGGRSRTGDLMPFHGGAAILALSHNVPILPLYIRGAMDILPAGTKYASPAPVTVRVGDLLRIPEGTNLGEAKHMMQQAVQALAHGENASNLAA